MENQVDLLDIPFVACQLKVSRPMVRELILTGKLSALDITPESRRRTWRVPATALTAYIQEQLKSSKAYLEQRQGKNQTA